MKFLLSMPNCIGDWEDTVNNSLPCSPVTQSFTVGIFFGIVLFKPLNAPTYRLGTGESVRPRMRVGWCVLSEIVYGQTRELTYHAQVLHPKKSSRRCHQCGQESPCLIKWTPSPSQFYLRHLFTLCESGLRQVFRELRCAGDGPRAPCPLGVHWCPVGRNFLGRGGQGCRQKEPMEKNGQVSGALSGSG